MMAATFPSFRWRVGIRTLLIFGVGGVTMLAVTAALLTGFINARENTRELLRDKAAAIIDAKLQQVHAQMRPVQRVATSFVEAVSNGRLEVDNRTQLSAYLEGVLSAAPQITAVAIIGLDGELNRYAREDRRLVTEHRANRSLMHRALVTGELLQGPTWGELIHPVPLGDTAINLRVPLRVDGRFLGLVTLVVAVTDLSRELARDQSPGLVSYILYDREWVLAHPLLVNWRPEVSGPIPLAPIEELADPVLSEVWSEQRYPTFMKDAEFDNDEESMAAIDIADRTYIFLHRTLTDYGEKPWTVGVYLNASSADTVIQRLQWTLGLGVGLVLASGIAIIIAARMISAPIRELAQVAIRVRGGKLDAVAPLANSSLIEIDEAANAFNAMVEGLRDRETIRTLFGKYVPEEIAVELLSQGGELSPSTGEATILFVDMEGFTTLTEALQPDQLVSVLNSYFSALVNVIESYGGVVTQFQGDAILATFNIPIADADHAAQAVRSACDILEVLKKQDFAGHQLKCRIGINTGEVTAGAVGAAGRLSYTVHGDAVNLAARLEVMNKQYGTRILMSEFTADHLDSSEFRLRPMGSATVRGRSQSVSLLSLGESENAGSEY